MEFILTWIVAHWIISILLGLFLLSTIIMIYGIRNAPLMRDPDEDIMYQAWRKELEQQKDNSHEQDKNLA